MFAKREASGDGLVGLFNTTNEAPATVSTTAAAIGMPASSQGYLLTDLWTHKTTETAGTISPSVNPQGVALLPRQADERRRPRRRRPRL